MSHVRRTRRGALVLVTALVAAVGCVPVLEAPPSQAKAHTETMHLVTHGERLFAAMGQWEDPTPDGAQIWVKRSASEPFEVFQDTASLRVQSLESFTVPAAVNGGVETSVLLTQFRDATSSRLHWLHGDADAFEESFDIGAGGVRSLGAHQEGSTFAFYAGVDPTGVLRGTWNIATQSIDWNPSPELTVPDGGINADKVTGFADCGGSAYVTIKTKMFRRNDGALPAGTPRWRLVYEAPGVGSGNSGLRGITCIDHVGVPALLVATEGRNAAILRFAPLPAPGSAGPTMTPAVEVEPRAVVRDFLATAGITVPETGRESVSYVIASYNEVLDTDIGGQPTQLLGLEWNYDQACPAARPCLPGNRFDAAACMLVRTVPDETAAYRLFCLGGPLVPAGTPSAPITSGEAFVATRTIRPSPWNPSVFYAGGYDANGIPAEGTAWIASFLSASVANP